MMTSTLGAILRSFLLLLVLVLAHVSAQSLTVSGRTDLYPTFSPEIERYYVILDEGVSSLEVAGMASDGAQWSLDGEPLGGARTLEVQAGDELELELTTGDAARGYSVLVLPSDFPELTVTTHTDAVTPGYVFITPNIDPGPGYRIIVDNYGVPVWYEQGRSYDLKRHPNGQYSYAHLTGRTNQHERVDHDITVLDENFERVRRYSAYNLNHTTHHDFLLLDEGHVVMLAYAGAYRDLTAFGGGPDDLVEDTIMQEVNGDEEVVLQWNSWDTVNYNERLWPNAQDYAHGNAVFLEPDGESFLISMRGTSEVIKVDRNTGELIWRLGGLSSDFTFPNPGDIFCGQHTPSRLESGNVLLFDNGQHCPPDGAERGTTRVAEYKLDEEAMTAELVWSYSPETVYSIAQGSAQRLGNGHTFIGWGMGQRKPVILGPNVTASEVDAEGNVVWELSAFYTGQFEGSEETRTLPANSYRAWRFPVDKLP